MDITNIIAALIGLLGTVITVFIVPYIKANTTAKQQSIIESVADIAVYAAQQLIDDDNEKKDYAMKKLTAYLTEHNITISTDTVSDYIEAAVKKIKGTW